MTERRVRREESILGLLLVGASVVALATCAGTARPPAQASPAPDAAAPEVRSQGRGSHGTDAGDAGHPQESSAESEPAVHGAAASEATGPLAAFWRQLSAVEQGRRKEPVRVLWLGDSHTAADYMTDAARQVLTGAYGSAGPGFVRVGVPHYRHARARFETIGKWRRLPQQPSRRSPVLDGVFGLCGMRTVPEANASVRLRLHDPKLGADAVVQFTLLYRLPPQAALEVQLQGRSRILRADGAGAEAGPGEGKIVSVEGSPIRRLVLEGRAKDELVVSHVAGAPEIFGVFVEATSGGVIVDTCGIDGARVATPLAWDGAKWQAEVRARAPDLVVLAYGTNEAFDDAAPRRYGPEYHKLLERLRAGAPELPCLVVGPPDAWDRAGRVSPRLTEITEVQRAAAEELGCGFVSARELMGGEGSFTAWRNATPALARADGVHLSSDGYERLGAELGEVLLPPSGPRSR